MRDKIKDYLKECSEKEFPKISEEIKTHKGFRKAESNIMMLLINEGVSLDEAVMLYEKDER